MDELRRYTMALTAALRSQDPRRVAAFLAAVATDLPPMGPEMAEVVMHKFRCELLTLEPEEREESARWLRERGFTRWTGLPL